jgi:hypothetical protein
MRRRANPSDQPGRPHRTGSIDLVGGRELVLHSGNRRDGHRELPLLQADVEQPDRRDQPVAAELFSGFGLRLERDLRVRAVEVVQVDGVDPSRSHDASHAALSPTLVPTRSIPPGNATSDRCARCVPTTVQRRSRCRCVDSQPQAQRGPLRSGDQAIRRSGDQAIRRSSMPGHKSGMAPSPMGSTSWQPSRRAPVKRRRCRYELLRFARSARRRRTLEHDPCRG